MSRYAIGFALALFMFGLPDCFGEIGGFQAHTGSAKSQLLGPFLHVPVFDRIVRALALGRGTPIGVLEWPVSVVSGLLEKIRMGCRALENALLFSRYQRRQDFQLGPVLFHRNLVGFRQIVQSLTAEPGQHRWVHRDLAGH